MRKAALIIQDGFIIYRKGIFIYSDKPLEEQQHQQAC